MTNITIAHTIKGINKTTTQTFDNRVNNTTCRSKEMARKRTIRIIIEITTASVNNRIRTIVKPIMQTVSIKRGNTRLVRI